LNRVEHYQKRDQLGGIASDPDQPGLHRFGKCRLAQRDRIERTSVNVVALLDRGPMGLRWQPCSLQHVSSEQSRYRPTLVY